MLQKSKEEKSYCFCFDKDTNQLINFLRLNSQDYKVNTIRVPMYLCPTTNAEKAEVEQFYEDLQDLLELTRCPKKNVLFIIGDWNEKVGHQEIPGITGKFGFGVQSEVGQTLTEFCQENTLIMANTLLQQQKRKRWLCI